MKYKKIVVAGGGVFGSQIAFQTAYCGFDVTVLVTDDEAAKKLMKKVDDLKKTYIKTIKVMNTKAGKAPGIWARGIADINHHNLNKCLNRVKNFNDNIKTETDQAKAVADADLVIESITEIYDVKKDTVKTKVGIPSILDIKFNSKVKSYFTSTINEERVLVYENPLRPGKVTTYRSIRPCITISKDTKLTYADGIFKVGE